jgi:hypothetical protein
MCDLHGPLRAVTQARPAHLVELNSRLRSDLRQFGNGVHVARSARSGRRNMEFGAAHALAVVNENLPIAEGHPFTILANSAIQSIAWGPLVEENGLGEFGLGFREGIGLEDCHQLRCRPPRAWRKRQASGLRARPLPSMALPWFRIRHCHSQCRSRRVRSRRRCTWISVRPSAVCRFPRHSPHGGARRILSCCHLTPGGLRGDVVGRVLLPLANRHRPRRRCRMILLVLSEDWLERFLRPEFRSADCAQAGGVPIEPGA